MNIKILSLVLESLIFPTRNPINEIITNKEDTIKGIVNDKLPTFPNDTIKKTCEKNSI